MSFGGLSRWLARQFFMPIYRASLCCLVLTGTLLAACREGGLPAAAEIASAQSHTPLPSRRGSLKFAVIGDSGRWSQEQRETADQLNAQHETFPFELVLMLGDNNYGDGSPQSYKVRFEEPFKALIDSGVKFYAALGNHDAGPQWNYPLFNMNGHRYYTFEEHAGVLPPLVGAKVRFFAVDTVNLDGQQLHWLDEELSGSKADWKIVFLHHPLYSSGRYASTSLLRRRGLETIFSRQGVDVVFAGHEHFYERIKPMAEVSYFVSGGSGSVRVGDLVRTQDTAAGYDRDLSFMLIEIAGDTMYFRAVNRKGETVDSGRVANRPAS